MKNSSDMRCSVNLMALLLIVAVTIGCGPKKENPFGMKFAHYSDFSFSGGGETYNTLWVGGKPDFVTRAVFIRDGEGKVHDLSLLTEETAQAWVDKYTPESLRDRAVGPGQRDVFEDAMFYEYPGRSAVIFHRGKVIDGSFSNVKGGPFEGLEVGRSADGEFVKMPVTREEMIRVFGEPLKETR